MIRTIEPKSMRDLQALLHQLAQMHEELTLVVQSKVEAIRRADLQALQTISEKERNIVNHIQEREGFRRQLMDAIGEQLGMPSRAARALTASQLASHIPKERAKGVLQAVDALRNAVARVARINRLTGVVSRELVNHLRWVFAAVKPVGEQRVGYTPTGVHAAVTDNRIFEALG